MADCRKCRKSLITLVNDLWKRSSGEPLGSPERHLAKVTVESSNLFTRSNFSNFPSVFLFLKKPVLHFLRKIPQILLADVSGNFVTIRKVINHGNSRWCVSATVEGKRTQRFFRTKVDARTWMSGLIHDPTDQFWKQLSFQERQLIMLTSLPIPNPF